MFLLHIWIGTCMSCANLFLHTCICVSYVDMQIIFLYLLRAYINYFCACNISMRFWISMWIYNFLFCSLDSEEEWQPASLPNTSKEAVLPPPTSKTPTPSACGSVRPRRARTPSKQTRGSSHSVRGTKRPASVMSEDGERWNDCSVEDEVPALPNFVPKRNPGAQLVMDRIYSPLQLFQLFFTSSVLDTIVKNTNAFARMRSEAGKRLWRKRRDFREDITSLQ